jgi:4-aminobutyrate aminotransferase-like enzyme
MARVVTGNRGLICTDAAYHGNSELVGSLSYLWPEPPESGDIRAFPFPDCYRPLEEGLSDEELCEAYLARVATAIESLNADGAGLAALIVCPIFANEGVPDVPAGFLARVTDLVHRQGGLVIADEVQSGYGRTGRWWGYESAGFLPDIITMGKPMGNGLPLAATAARKKFVDAFRAAKDYFNTCASTPLQAAVGMAVMDEIERLDLLGNAAEVGARLTRELGRRVASHDAIGDVRGCGLFISVEMIKDGGTKEPDAASTGALCDRLKDRGFLVSYSGKFDNVLKIRPPLVFSHANADDFLLAFDECIEELGE